MLNREELKNLPPLLTTQELAGQPHEKEEICYN